jgi:hypothetical protein
MQPPTRNIIKDYAAVSAILALLTADRPPTRKTIRDFDAVGGRV